MRCTLGLGSVQRVRLFDGETLFGAVYHSFVDCTGC